MAKPTIQGVTQMKRVITSLDQALFKSDDHSREIGRRLFRALLRQCSYLPDDAARCYCHTSIVKRYRRYHPRPPVAPSLTVQRRLQAIKQARKTLALLERANDGYSSHLLKVLSMTYARIGKRRRQILSELHGSAIPKDEDSTACFCIPMNDEDDRLARAARTEERATLQASNRSFPSIVRSDWGPFLGDRLEALAKSQKKLGQFQSINKQIRKVIPDIPRTNDWGRPMPLKRVLNLKNKWFARILKKIQPPLAEEEWNRLRDLAIGRIPWKGPIRRRTKVASDSVFDGKDSTISAWECAETTPSLDSGQNGGKISQLLHKRPLKSNPHNITGRFMRALWTQVFVQCPKMQWDAAQNTWLVTWGDSSVHDEVVLNTSTPVDDCMFQGVNDQGKRI